MSKTRKRGVIAWPMDMYDLNFDHCFDGIWAMASFLHVEPISSRTVLTRFMHNLKPQGVIFLTLQEGRGELTRNGRTYTLYTAESLKGLVDGVGGLKLEQTAVAPSRQPGRTMNWLSAIIRRSW